MRAYDTSVPPNDNISLRVLLAEDDPDDIYLFRSALENVAPSVRLEHFKDGNDALDHLRKALIQHATLPDLIFIDLCMPNQDGKSLLRQIKAAPGLRCVPVVILSTSHAKSDITDCYAFGANSYIVKPDCYDKMITILHNITQYWFKTVQLSQD